MIVIIIDDSKNCLACKVQSLCVIEKHSYVMTYVRMDLKKGILNHCFLNHSQQLLKFTNLQNSQIYLTKFDLLMDSSKTDNNRMTVKLTV